MLREIAGSDASSPTDGRRCGSGRAAACPKLETLHRPFETNDPALKPYLDAMAKYTSSSQAQIVEQFPMEAWLSTELMFYGLQQAGSCPTRSSVINALENSTTWDGNGLLPRPVDFDSLRKSQETTDCMYIVTANSTGTAWVPEQGFAPYCANPGPITK